MSKAKPTHMRPILEAAIASGELTFSTRKASRWALVTIDDLTARLAAAEAERDVERRDRTAAEFELLATREKLAAEEKANCILSKANELLKRKCATACAACDAIRSDYHELRVECQGVRSELATAESLARESTGDLREADRMIDQLRLQLKEVSE